VLIDTVADRLRSGFVRRWRKFALCSGESTPHLQMVYITAEVFGRLVHGCDARQAATPGTFFVVPNVNAIVLRKEVHIKRPGRSQGLANLVPVLCDRLDALVAPRPCA